MFGFIGAHECKGMAMRECRAKTPLNTGLVQVRPKKLDAKPHPLSSLSSNSHSEGRSGFKRLKLVFSYLLWSYKYLEEVSVFDSTHDVFFRTR